MTETPTTERPLVTFALFAYNQEQYIREAVEGAFAQTYEPLEIILSDDCSSDRTYEIMQEMAAAYDGPHEVKVRQSEVNRGLAQHINDVIKVTHGDIVLLAAGDDISHPERAAKHVDVYKTYPDTHAVFSDYNQFPITTNRRYPSMFPHRVGLPEVIYNGGGVQLGATYSYRRECFTWPMQLPEWLASEDRLLPYRALLLGTLRFTPNALVEYRISLDAKETTQRKKRVHGLNHKNHFPQLLLELKMAISQKRIGAVRGRLCLAFTRARATQLALLRIDRLPRILPDMLFFPLRLVRKASVIFISRTAQKPPLKLTIPDQDKKPTK